MNRVARLAVHLRASPVAEGEWDPEDDGDVTTEQKGHIFIITLNRGQKPKYNGFTPKMLDMLARAYSKFENTESARVGIIHGAGKHFTSGMDMALVTFDAKTFPVNEVDPVGLYPPKRTKPMICVAHGVSFTVGTELALASDIIVAAKGTRFGQLEVKRGTISFFGGTFRLIERAGYGNAMRYLLTGDEFNEQQAKDMNLVQEIEETPEAAFAKALEIAEKIAAQAPIAVRETMRSADVYLNQGLDSAVNLLAGQVRMLRETEDFAEGVLSFKQKRDAKYKGR